MRYSPEHKAKTRKSILDAASRVFRRRGYQGGGVDAVMKEAGLTHGGFYAHFQNKEALLAETVLDAMLEARKRHRDWTAGTSGATWLGRFLDHYLSDRHRRHSEHGCPVPALVSEPLLEGDLRSLVDAVELGDQRRHRTAVLAVPSVSVAQVVVEETPEPGRTRGAG
ncbi:MAG: TetR/AcrR family transcriptional regulator, partial [Acidobacteriota bacterium]